MSYNYEKSVMIVGAGPVGLSLALFLAKNNVSVAVFERETQLADEIRASTFHPATLEILAQFNVAEPLIAAGHKVSSLQFWDRKAKDIIADFDYRVIGGDTEFPFRLQCPQHQYCDLMLDELQNYSNVKIHWGYEFSRIKSQDKDSVKVEFKSREGLAHFDGRFLCAADGANSTVRNSLGIAFKGLTYEDRFLLVGTNINLDDYYPGIGSVNYMFDADEWVIVLHLKGVVRIVFRVPSELSTEKAISDANIRSCLDGFIGDNSAPILHKSIYRVHQRVANRFVLDQVVLLGDSAHINNPASGMGMNSGIQDAYELAQGLLKYLSTGDRKSLCDYEESRRSFALDNIQKYTDTRYKDLSSSCQEYQSQRNKRYREINESPALCREYLLRASMLGHRI